MRAVVAEKAGAPVVVRNVDAPPIRPNQVLVRVRAAGVNPFDWKVRDNMFGDTSFPVILGQDFAGVVERAGESATLFAPGDRIFGSAAKGSYAEYVAVAVTRPVAKTPSALDDVHAAALPGAGITGLACVEATGVGGGDTLLIVGATGGVGGFATQIARARGVRVIAAALSHSADTARAFGATDVIAVDRSDLVTTVKASHPQGVDGVIDLVSDSAALQRIASLLRPGGRAVSTIGSADEAWFERHNLEATNIDASKSSVWSTAGLQQLLRLVESGDLTIRVGTRAPLADAERVLRDSKAGLIQGKAVLVV